MRLTPEEDAILGGERGDAARRALEYQIEVGRFRGARRFVAEDDRRPAKVIAQ